MIWPTIFFEKAINTAIKIQWAMIEAFLFEETVKLKKRKNLIVEILHAYL